MEAADQRVGMQPGWRHQAILSIEAGRSGDWNGPDPPVPNGSDHTLGGHPCQAFSQKNVKKA
jgi:hypothetical protein